MNVPLLTRTQDPPPPDIDLDTAIEQLRQKFKIPKVVVDRMVQQESGGKTDALSPKGARGRFQVMPGTLEMISRETGKKLNNDDPLDNAYAGLYLLNQNYNKFRKGAPSERGAWMRSVAAYHAGAGAVQKDLESGGLGIPDIGDGLINTRDHVYNIFSDTKPEDFDVEGESQPPLLSRTLTPKVTSTVKDLDESVATVPPIQFQPGGPVRTSSLNPVKAIYEALDEKEIKPRGLANLQSRDYKEPLSREIGERVKVPFSSHLNPTEDDLVKAYLGTLGPQYVQLADKYKAETGQSILNLGGGQVQFEQDGFYVRPSRGAIDFINSYAEGGLGKALPLAEKQRQEFIAAQNEAIKASQPTVDRARRAVEIEKERPAARGLFTAGAGPVQAGGTLAKAAEYAMPIQTLLARSTGRQTPGEIGQEMQATAGEMRAAGEQTEIEKPLASLSKIDQLKYGAGAVVPTAATLAVTRGFGSAQLPALGVLEGQTPQERIRGGLEGVAMHAAMSPIPNQLGESLS